jgi:hypothetical protein
MIARETLVEVPLELVGIASDLTEALAVLARALRDELFDRRDQTRWTEGLLKDGCDVSFVDGCDGGIEIEVSRNQEAATARLAIVELTEQGQAASAREAIVDHRHGEFVLSDEARALFRSARGRHEVASSRQHSLEGTAETVVVVDDEDVTIEV